MAAAAAFQIWWEWIVQRSGGRGTVRGGGGGGGGCGGVGGEAARALGAG